MYNIDMNKNEAKNNWYVVTGPPCSGKTTLIEILEKKGYKITPEAARVFIDRCMTKGQTLEEIRKDNVSFQKNILTIKLETEKNLDKDQIVFLDRGIPDTVAYTRFHKERVDDFLEDLVKKCGYKKIFLLNPLPYVADYARNESKEEQDTLHKLLYFAYADFGFDVVKVPVFDVEKRVQFVLDNL